MASFIEDTSVKVDSIFKVKNYDGINLFLLTNLITIIFIYFALFVMVDTSTKIIAFGVSIFILILSSYIYKETTLQDMMLTYKIRLLKRKNKDKKYIKVGMELNNPLYLQNTNLFFIEIDNKNITILNHANIQIMHFNKADITEINYTVKDNILDITIYDINLDQTNRFLFKDKDGYISQTKTDLKEAYLYLSS